MGKWEMVRLGDIIKLTNGYAFDSKYFTDSSSAMPLVRIRDIVRGYTETYTTESYDTDYVIKKGDLLIGMDGEFNIAVWNGNIALLNQRVCKIESNTQSLINKYILYFLPPALKIIEASTPYVTVKHLSSKKISDIQIPLPPVKIQQKIAAVLDKASELIELRKTQLDKLDLLIKSQFIEMFGNPITNPMKWEFKRLGEFCTINRGGSPRPIEQYLGGTIPWIKIGDATLGDDIYLRSTKENIIEAGVKKK